MEEEIINLSDILDAIKRRWALIVGISFGAAIVAAIVSLFLLTPTYETSTKLFIGKEEGSSEGYNSSDISMYQNLLGTYSQAIQTNDLIEKAINNTGYDYEAKDVKANLTVTTVTGTQIIQVSYVDNSPISAQKILNEITNEFINLSEELVPNGNVKVIETAKIPENPAGPNTKMNIAIAFILGVVISIGIVFLMEYLDNTFKTKDQLEKELDIPVLGTIPKMKLD